MRTLVIGAALVFGAACATSQHSSFAPASELRFYARDYPDDAAVMLSRSERTELASDNGETFTLRSRHQVVAVLAEGGFELAEVRIPMWQGADLLSFEARVVQPDGSQHVYGARHLLVDAAGREERDLNALFFRFPDVRVGSVLEYAWHIRTPLWSLADEQETLGVYPVRRYQFELIADRGVVVETISFNGGVPIEVVPLSDGRSSLRFELKDLPPRASADYAPHWTFTEPRWSWRAVGYGRRGYRVDFLRDWTHVVQPRGKAFFVEGELQRGLDLKLDVASCADVKCQYERALAMLDGRSTTADVAWDREANLAAALASGTTSVVERALLMKHLLEGQGLDVWLAYGTSKLGQPLSQAFPRLHQFDRLFVHLPVQKGVEQAVTLDPSCAACSYGQMPEPYAGTSVYVFKTWPRFDEVTTRGDWQVAPEAAPASRLRTTHLLRVDARGTIEDLQSVRYFGPEVEVVRGRQRWTEKQRWNFEEHQVRWVPVARLRELTWSECSASSCGWESVVEFPAQARLEGERWLVPTTFLRPWWEGQFESGERVLDVHFPDAEALEEVAEVLAPAGFELAEVPAPRTLVLGGVRSEVRVEKTAEGARLRRTLTHEVTTVARAEAAQLRELVESFRAGRREVLVFSKKK